MAKRKLTARQVRWLFATGRLKASGKGKDRKVTYSKEGGGGKPSKAQRDSTRAARIAAGNKRLEQFAGRQAAAYKARLAPDGKEMAAKFGGKFSDTGKEFKAGDRIFYSRDRGATSRPRRPSLTDRERSGAKRAEFTVGTMDKIPLGKSGNRADRVQRAAAVAVAKQANASRADRVNNRYLERGRAFDRSSADRARATARSFKSFLRSTGAKEAPSPRQAKVASSRKKLADALRQYRRESPALAREKLLKLKTEPQYKKNLKNPFRTRTPGKG